MKQRAHVLCVCNDFCAFREIPKLSCYKSSKSIQPILTSLRVIHLLLNSPSQAVQGAYVLAKCSLSPCSPLTTPINLFLFEGSSRVDTLMELMSCESMDNLTTLLQVAIEALLIYGTCANIKLLG